MKSYKKLTELSNKLIIHEHQENEMKSILKNEVNEFHSYLSEDFNILFNHKLNLISYHIFLNDDTYRQTSKGLILNSHIINNKEFILRFECLIDHGRIWLKIKDGKEIKDFINITNKIAEYHNNEEQSEFFKIK